MVVAFAKLWKARHPESEPFRGRNSTARTFAYLRIAHSISGTGARLATDSGGLTLSRTGFAPAGRQTKFHEGIASSNSSWPAWPGRTKDWLIKMAKENRGWGYDRIVGALAELGYDISDQTVGNILKRHGIPTAPDRKKTTTWKEFIRSHMDVLWATDFFSTEVWTLGGLVTFYILFFIKLDTREVHIVGITAHPNEQWMMQIARNLTMDEWGILKPGQYLIHDRDKKFCLAYNQLLDDTKYPDGSSEPFSRECAMIYQGISVAKMCQNIWSGT